MCQFKILYINWPNFQRHLSKRYIDDPDSSHCHLQVLFHSLSLFLHIARKRVFCLISFWLSGWERHWLMSETFADWGTEEKGHNSAASGRRRQLGQFLYRRRRPSERPNECFTYFTWNWKEIVKDYNSHSSRKILKWNGRFFLLRLLLFLLNSKKRVFLKPIITTFLSSSNILNNLGYLQVVMKC